MEVMEFIWQDVCVGDEVKLASSESFLHLNIIEAETILPSDLVALREVIDSLEFVEAFVQIALAG